MASTVLGTKYNKKQTMSQLSWTSPVPPNALEWLFLRLTKLFPQREQGAWDFILCILGVFNSLENFTYINRFNPHYTLTNRKLFYIYSERGN